MYSCYNRVSLYSSDWSHCTAQASVKLLVILLPQTPWAWAYGEVLLHLALFSPWERVLACYWWIEAGILFKNTKSPGNTTYSELGVICPPCQEWSTLGSSPSKGSGVTDYISRWLRVSVCLPCHMPLLHWHTSMVPQNFLQAVSLT